MSRAGLVSSLSTWSIVNVPASICCRSGGQGSVASLVGILVNLPEVSGADRLERLGWHHRPTNRYDRALGIDKTEGVQTVVRAVRKPGRDRMIADPMHGLGGFRMLGEKSLHPGRIRLAYRRIGR
jgi:hypothetical protein